LRLIQSLLPLADKAGHPFLRDFIRPSDGTVAPRKHACPRPAASHGCEGDSKDVGRDHENSFRVRNEGPVGCNEYAREIEMVRKHLKARAAFRVRRTP
jgi:hypothetical protein